MKLPRDVSGRQLGLAPAKLGYSFTMIAPQSFLSEHDLVSRRSFLRLGAAGAAGIAFQPIATLAETPSPELAGAFARLESFLTPPGQFRDVSRGKPLPHSLPEEKKREVGLTRESWKLEVISDPDHPARIRQPLTKAAGTALDFSGLMQLAETRAVRFLKVMTCLNIGCPLGTGIWEGVPLREIIWRTEPREDLRRVFYYGYHNDDPKQMFRSSLPIGRVLEDYHGLPPVILCYKLNGEWLSPQRGGPVRIVVPEAYGFKSIKWVTRVVLTNLAHANDTYADANNDIDSPLKTFAATLSVPTEVKAGEPIPITGYAQVGISGLSKVQVWVHPDAQALPSQDRYFTTAPWTDAQILPPPKRWGGNLPGDSIPPNTLGFDSQGRPRTWPMRLSKVHWAVLLPGLPAGKYTLRSRTIDENGNAQPMPRPFRKSGHAEIEQVSLVVKPAG
ncbi:MAG: molybdopterin-dependent oxidoreductase [Verrucomicrobia bacterium]|nr:molybdopterin-dependent oxidoreductase [Verrucomicrobiota bacterium]